MNTLKCNNLSAAYKGNELINARFPLSLNQQRLILLLISIIDPGDDDFHDYELRASDFTAMFGIESQRGAINTLEEAALDLVGKRINLGSGDHMLFVTWLSKAEYTQGTGVITIRFDSSLKPYLLHLKSRFTQYRLQDVVKFKSAYSIRLYELLKAHQSLGGGKAFYRTMSLAELKEIFAIDPGEYDRFAHFWTRVIEPAVAEINRHSDINVSNLAYLKEGRRVTGITFTVEPKEGPEAESKAAPENTTQKRGETKEPKDRKRNPKAAETGPQKTGRQTR